jgi:hypothetical protein
MKPNAVLFSSFLLEFLCHFGVHVREYGRVHCCKANGTGVILDPLYSVPQRGHMSTVVHCRQGEETRPLLPLASVDISSISLWISVTRAKNDWFYL